MKKFILILCISLVLVCLLPRSVLARDIEGLPPVVTTEAVLLIETNTGKVLFEKNADKVLYPASTTKIMTALLLLEHAQLKDVVVAGEEIEFIGPGSSRARLNIGDKLTVAELIYALMLPSGNDAAYTAAAFIGRLVSGFDQMDAREAVDVFVHLMNQRAQELGAMNTNFTAPDGYHDPEHYSTARDLAIITQEALKHEFMLEVVSSKEYVWQETRWNNTNRMLHAEAPQAYYPWATGFKTGYTPQAGFCLVATASGGGMDLLAVFLNSTRDMRWLDSRAILDYGFDSWRPYTMFVEGRSVFNAPVKDARREQPSNVEVRAGGGFSGVFEVHQIPDIELDFDWARGVLDSRSQGLVFKAPIQEGQVLGRAIITLDGEVLGEVELISATTVLGRNWWLLITAGLTMTMALVLGISLFTRKRRPKHLSR